MHIWYPWQNILLSNIRFKKMSIHMCAYEQTQRFEQVYKKKLSNLSSWLCASLGTGFNFLYSFFLLALCL